MQYAEAFVQHRGHAYPQSTYLFTLFFEARVRCAAPISKVAPDWWDYTTLDDAILRDAAQLTDDDLVELSRDGFQVKIYDTLEEFYCAEALEYIAAWRQARPTLRSASAGPSVRRSSCRWWRRWSTHWT